MNGIDTSTLINPARRRLFTRKPSTAKHLRLPWVKSEALFIEKCTKCHKCISACETRIITPDPDGFPRVDFSDGECTFCTKCIDSCEQNLFVEEAKRGNTLSDVCNHNKVQPWPGTITLKADAKEQNCLAANDIYCQSCGDECEVEAIKFSYHKTNQQGEQVVSAIPQPQLTIDDCTQCGACISNCPQDAINLTVNDFSYQR